MSDVIKLTTPIGRLSWPKLFTPDCYREKGQEPDPLKDKYYYSTKMILNPEDPEVIQFLEKLDTLAQDAMAPQLAHVGKGKKPRYVEGFYSRNEELDDEGNETGNIILSFRAMSHGVKNGREWSRKVHVVDLENEPFDPDGKELSSGTMAKVSFELRGYTSSGKIGVSLQLRAVKVIVPKFMSKGGNDDFADDEVTAEDFAKIGESVGDDSGDF